MNGKMKDIYIRENYNGETGEFSCLSVWTDHNAVKVLAGVEGVSLVIDRPNKNEYLVKIDPRYDVEWMQQEIIAILKCAHEDA